MKDRFLSIFNQVKEEHLKFHEKILFVDGTNTFIRSIAVNTTVSDNGDHVGGIIGFLLSVGFAIKTIRPTRVIIIFDGKNGSKYRKQIYPEYKANRASRTMVTKMFASVQEEQLSILTQIKRLIEYLHCLPLQFVVADDIEADDAIAYFVTQKFNTPEIKKVIMSTDQDFLQLVDGNTTVWSPTKKIFFTFDNFKDLVGIHHNNYLILKSIVGDKSDNVSGIKGCGQKTLEKRFPMLFEEKSVTIEELIDYAKSQNQGKQKYKIYDDFIAGQEKLKLNYQVVQLMDTHISDYTKILLSNAVDRDVPSLDKIQFLKYITEDRLNLNLKNPDFWIRDVWFNLQMTSANGKT